MRAWNEAVEGVAEYQEFLRKAMTLSEQTEQRRPSADDYRYGENRKERRARLREEARQAKRAAKAKAPA